VIVVFLDNLEYHPMPQNGKLDDGRFALRQQEAQRLTVFGLNPQ
jgi:hypothetical protein